MTRFDFPSVIAILTGHMSREGYGNQVDLMYLLFEEYAYDSGYLFDNAELLSNIHNNAGLCYWELGKLDLAQFHLEQSIHLREAFDRVNSHDSVVQITNYANFLAFLGQYQKSYDALVKLAGYLETGNPVSEDHAAVLQSLAMLCTAAGQIPQAQNYLTKAMQIYKTVYSSDPEMLEQKRQTLMQLLREAQEKKKSLHFGSISHP